MSWVCVLNPSAATFEAVRPLLAEAYELAVSKRAKRAARGGSRAGGR
jgi:predicted DNA-binding protein (MmcQ/YjbR family)